MNQIPLYDAAVLVLASGRIAYSLTQDTIFKSVRERIWDWSPPHSAKVEVDGQEVPARMVSRFKTNEWERSNGAGKWMLDFHAGDVREPGFWGQLAECFYCMTFWTSALALGAYALRPEQTVSLLSIFALWALANLYAKVLHA